MNAKTLPRLPTGYRNTTHKKAAAPTASAGVANDTLNNLSNAASRRIDVTQTITNADLYGFCAFPANCEETFMTVDLRTDAGF